MRRPVSLAALALIATLWNAALVAAPAAAAPPVAAVAYASGALICHQQPDRSFHRNGAQYPVCARCLGLYLGALGGVLGWCLIAGVKAAPAARAQRLIARDALRRVLVIVAAPTIVSVCLAWLSMWDGTNIVRAALAVPLGANLAAIIAAVAAGDLR